MGKSNVKSNGHDNGADNVSATSDADKQRLSTSSKTSERHDNVTITSDNGAITEENEKKTSRYVCPICGKEFSSEKSLKMHMIRTHRTTPKGERGEGKVVEEPEKLPTESDQLLHILRLAGVSENLSKAIVLMCENRGFDLLTLDQALMQAGIAIDKRRLILQLWADLKNQPIPVSLRKKYGLLPSPQYGYQPYYQPSYDSYGNPYPPKGSDVLLGKVVDHLGDLLKTLMARQNNPPHNSNNDAIVQQLLQQNQSLLQQIADLKEQIYKKEVEHLRKELEEIKKNSATANQYGVIIKILDNLDKKTDRFLDLVEKLATPLPPKPKQYAEISSSNEILDVLPPDLVEKEEGGDLGEQEE